VWPDAIAVSTPPAALGAKVQQHSVSSRHPTAARGIFKNYAPKSIDHVRQKFHEAILYVEHNPGVVKSITSFPHIAKSF
jgi:hypothetical protein